MPLTNDQIESLLGKEAHDLLTHVSKTVPKEQLHLPGPDFVERVFMPSDRSIQVLRNLQQIFDCGRLGGTGYLSLLPVDQGVELTGGSAFAYHPAYFDPENILKLAIEGGCNGVVSTLGILGAVARKYAHKIPFILKLNHNELLTYPHTFDQVFFASVEQAFDLGAAAVAATIFFGSEESRRQIVNVSHAFQRAHELGMGTILFCYLRNDAFTVDGVNYEVSADMTGQANYMGVTIEADIVKQKQPTVNRGLKAVPLKISPDYGHLEEKIYTELTSNHPIDLTRYQVINNFMGRVGLINSGGASGKNDLAQAVRTAIINKRAGGMGLISGRKAFQKPIVEGIEILNAIQDVYLNEDITIA